MKKNFFYKAGLIATLLLFCFYIKSENCTYGKECKARFLKKMNAMQQINTPVSEGIARYYPFCIEL